MKMPCSKSPSTFTVHMFGQKMKASGTVPSVNPTLESSPSLILESLCEEQALSSSEYYPMQVHSPLKLLQQEMALRYCPRTSTPGHHQKFSRSPCLPLTGLRPATVGNMFLTPTISSVLVAFEQGSICKLIH